MKDRLNATPQAKALELRRPSTESTKTEQKDKVPTSRKVGKRHPQCEPASRIQSLEESIPSEFRPLISETTIDLSGASAFYKRMAKTTQFLKEFVESLPNDHYRLKNGFDDWCLASLHAYGLRNWETPANTLAYALFHLSIYWARIEYGHIPKDVELYKQFLAEPWKDVDEELKVLLRSRSLTMPMILCAVQNDNTLAEATWSEPIERPLELSLAFAVSLQEPPSMTIKVRGRPAADFMSWWMWLDKVGSQQAHRDHEKLCHRVNTLLRSIVRTVEETMGLKQGRGRPAENLSERIAYAIDHEHKSLRAATIALCSKKTEPNHKCGNPCFDRTRKAHENYYKQLAGKLKGLMSVNRK